MAGWDFLANLVTHTHAQGSRSRVYITTTEFASYVIPEDKQDAWLSPNFWTTLSQGMAAFFSARKKLERVKQNE